MPLPQGRAAYKSVKVNWSGLDYRDDYDTGSLSKERNISTECAPHLTPSQKSVSIVPIENYFESETPVDIKALSLYGFDDYLVLIHSENYKIYATYIKTADNGIGDRFICRLNAGRATIDDAYDRDIVQFNVYDRPTDVLEGGYIKRLLVFPDKVSMPVFSDIVKISGQYPGDCPQNPDRQKLYCFTNGGTDIKAFTYYTYNGTNWAQSGDAGYFAPSSMDVTVKSFTNSVSPYLPPDGASRRYYWKNTYNSKVYAWVHDEADSENSGWRERVNPAMPPIKHACVHLSRLFGVDDERIYASGFNDYTNWNLDTAEEYNESNAWCSPAQSNTKADSKFTGITAFENHVICFKKDFMHEIYNTKNPFRIQDIYEEGTIDNRTIQNVDGKLFFVSPDGVKIYTGANPRVISDNLNIDEYIYAVSGTDGRFYYLYSDNDDGVSPVRRLLIFDTQIGVWSEREIGTRIRCFANTKSGLYMLCEKEGHINPRIYKLDCGGYTGQVWSFETDLMTRQGGAPTVDIKHIKKIQLLADLKAGAGFCVYALYDGESFNSQTSQLLYSSGTALADKTVPVRVKARKSAHYSLKLHFEGSGYVKLYEMELFFEQGGDLYVR